VRLLAMPQYLDEPCSLCGTSAGITCEHERLVRGPDAPPKAAPSLTLDERIARLERHVFGAPTCGDTSDHGQVCLRPVDHDGNHSDDVVEWLDPQWFDPPPPVEAMAEVVARQQATGMCGQDVGDGRRCGLRPGHTGLHLP
jgi:hypothetical protein